MRAMLGGFLGIVALACNASPVSQTLMDSERTLMRAATDSFTAYVVMHRDSLAAGLYAENATLMPPNHAPIKGRAAIRAFIKEFPRLQRFTVSPIEIEGRGDLAYVRGSYQMTFESGATDFGKFLEIRRHQADGRWLVTLDIYNSDMAPPAAPAAGAGAGRR
jgi:ketosteroid isomerase-like protein